MDQFYIIIGNFLLEHPQLLAFIVAYLLSVKIVTAFVDSLVSTRAEWDATPDTEDTWYEKALVRAVLVVKFLGKIAGYLSGFRPKPKAEIIQEEKK